MVSQIYFTDDLLQCYPELLNPNGFTHPNGEAMYSAPFVLCKTFFGCLFLQLNMQLMHLNAFHSLIIMKVICS